MELPDYLSALRRRWYAIVALLVIGAIVGWIVAAATPKTYAGDSSIYVSFTGASTSAELAQSGTYVQNSMPTYTALATSAEVLDPVISRLDLQQTTDQLAKSVSAENPLNTVVIDVRAESTSAARAQSIAKAVAKSLGDAIEKLTPSLTIQQTPKPTPSAKPGASQTTYPTVTVKAVKVEQLASGAQSTRAVAPSTLLFIAVGAVIGLIVGVLLALALVARRTTPSTKEELAPAESDAGE